MRRELISMTHELLCDKYRSMMKQDLFFAIASGLLVILMFACAGLRLSQGSYVWCVVHVCLAVLNLRTLIQCIKRYLDLRSVLRDLCSAYEEFMSNIEE